MGPGTSQGAPRTGDDGQGIGDEWDTPTAINTNRHSGTLSPPMSSHGIGEGSSLQPATDFSVREVDQVYGRHNQRGPPLSEQPFRRLGTGPADPTGPISTAKGWFKKALGRKPEKKGTFEVVRSAKRPDFLTEMQGARARGQPGVPAERLELAMNQDPSSSDEETPRTRKADKSIDAFDTDSDIDEGEGYLAKSGNVPQDDRGLLSVPHVVSPNNGQEQADMLPSIPRKSSKRQSRVYDQSASAHSRSASGTSNISVGGVREGGSANDSSRPASLGNVQRHRMHDSLRVPTTDLPFHSSAEFSSAASDKSGNSGADKK